MNNDIIARGLVRLASTQSSAKTRATLLKVAQGLGFTKIASDADDINDAKVANLHLFAMVLNNALGVKTQQSPKFQKVGPNPNVRQMMDENSLGAFFSKYGISTRDIASKQDSIRVHYWEHQAVPSLMDASKLKGYQSNKASNYFKFFNSRADSDLTDFNKEVTQSLAAVVGTVIDKLSAKFLERVQADTKISNYVTKTSKDMFMMLNGVTTNSKQETVYLDLSAEIGPALVGHLFKVIDNYITNNDLESAVLDRQADRHAKAEVEFVDKVNKERTKKSLTQVKDLKEALQTEEAEEVVVTLKDIKGNDLILNGDELLKNVAKSIIKKTSHSLPTNLQYLAIYSTIFESNRNAYQNAAKKRIAIAKSAMGCPIGSKSVDPPCAPKKADATYSYGKRYGFDAVGALKTFNSLNNNNLFDSLTVVPIQAKVAKLNRYLVAPFDMGLSREQIKTMMTDIFTEIGKEVFSKWEDQVVGVFYNIETLLKGSIKTEGDIKRLYDGCLSVTKYANPPSLDTMRDMFHSKMTEKVFKLRKPFDKAHNILTDDKGTYSVDLTKTRADDNTSQWITVLVKEAGLVAGGTFKDDPAGLIEAILGTALSTNLMNAIASNAAWQYYKLEKEEYNRLNPDQIARTGAVKGTFTDFANSLEDTEGEGNLLKFVADMNALDPHAALEAVSMVKQVDPILIKSAREVSEVALKSKTLLTSAHDLNDRVIEALSRGQSVDMSTPTLWGLFSSFLSAKGESVRILAKNLKAAGGDPHKLFGGIMLWIISAAYSDAKFWKTTVSSQGESAPKLNNIDSMGDLLDLFLSVSDEKTVHGVVADNRGHISRNPILFKPYALDANKQLIVRETTAGSGVPLTTDKQLDEYKAHNETVARGILWSIASTGINEELGTRFTLTSPEDFLKSVPETARTIYKKSTAKADLTSHLLSNFKIVIAPLITFANRMKALFKIKDTLVSSSNQSIVYYRSVKAYLNTLIQEMKNLQEELYSDDEEIEKLKQQLASELEDFTVIEVVGSPKKDKDGNIIPGTGTNLGTTQQYLGRLRQKKQQADAGLLRSDGTRLTMNPRELKALAEAEQTEKEIIALQKKIETTTAGRHANFEKINKKIQSYYKTFVTLLNSIKDMDTNVMVNLSTSLEKITPAKTVDLGIINYVKNSSNFTKKMGDKDYAEFLSLAGMSAIKTLSSVDGELSSIGLDIKTFDAEVKNSLVELEDLKITGEEGFKEIQNDTEHAVQDAQNFLDQVHALKTRYKLASKNKALFSLLNAFSNRIASTKNPAIRQIHINILNDILTNTKF